MDLINLSVQDIFNLRKFMELADEANEACTVIRKHYAEAFGLGKTVIPVYNCEYANADLSVDGKWFLHNEWGGNHDFVVEVTVDGIYAIFREAYFEETEQKFNARESKSVAFHLRNFVKQLKEKDKE